MLGRAPLAKQDVPVALQPGMQLALVLLLPALQPGELGVRLNVDVVRAVLEQNAVVTVDRNTQVGTVNLERQMKWSERRLSSSVYFGVILGDEWTSVHHEINHKICRRLVYLFLDDELSTGPAEELAICLAH